MANNKDLEIKFNLRKVFAQAVYNPIQILFPTH
jgi:hypothetical protein